jgi:AcrR family transcriptional regulator
VARPIAKDYDDKRRLILDKAAALFADEGFDRTSVAEVARACGISKANIYHYYNAKNDILFDILDDYLCTLRDRICGLPTGGNPEQDFRNLLSEILLAYQGADHQHRLQSGSIRHLPQQQQDILTGYQRDLVRHLSDRLSALVPEVFASDRIKLRATSMSVFGMLNWFYMWNRNANEQARRDYADLVATLCLKGLPGL